MKVEHILNSSSTNALKKKKEYKTGENPFSLLKSVLFVARVGLKEGKLSHKFCCTIYIYISNTRPPNSAVSPLMSFFISLPRKHHYRLSSTRCFNFRKNGDYRPRNLSTRWDLDSLASEWRWILCSISPREVFYYYYYPFKRVNFIIRNLNFFTS